MIDPLEIHAYADGQLAPEDRARVEAHIESNPSAKAEYDSVVSLKKALGRSLPAIECQSEWRACVKRLDELDKARKTETFVGKYAWSLCGVFLLFILAGGLVSRFAPGQNMQAADLARVAASLSPVDSPRSQQPKEIAQYLDHLVGAASQTLSNNQLRIVNAAAGEIDGHRVAKLGLMDDTGELALLVINAPLDLSSLPDAHTQGFKASQFQGMNSVIWSNGRFTMVLAADRPYDELIDIATNKVAP